MEVKVKLVEPWDNHHCPFFREYCGCFLVGIRYCALSPKGGGYSRCPLMKGDIVVRRVKNEEDDS